MEQTQLPITIWLWLLAVFPFATLLVLLVWARWKAAEAGPVGMFIAWAIAMLAFQTPLRTVAVAGGKGVWDAIFILYVIWPALLLYQVVERAGGFDSLRVGIRRFSNNQLFLVLAFGWVFASFLQGIAGFGTPIAVVAPLLLAIGVRPLYAVIIPLIGHAWANFFGTLAVSWLATQRVIDMQVPMEIAWQSAVLLWIPNALAGLGIAWLFGRWAALRTAWPMVLIITLIHGGGQLVLSLWNPVLSNFIPVTIAVAVLYPLSRWQRYSDPDPDIKSRPIMSGEGQGGDAKEEKEPVMGLTMALLPYIVLTVVAVTTLIIPPLENRLEQVEVGLAFPEVSTGYEVTNEAEDPYSPITPLTHPGIFLLIASLITYIVYRLKGYYSRWSRRSGSEGGIWGSVLSSALSPSVAVVAFLVTSQIFSHSGQTHQLALGISAVSPPLLFAGLANFIGVLGAFMTSSSTASNVLLAPLQSTIAEAEAGLSQSTLVAAQSAGGAIGNAIAPANAVLGTGTVGISGQEGPVLRRTLVWSLIVAVLVGLVTMVLPGGGLYGGEAGVGPEQMGGSQ
jgi:lactate permease